MKITNVLLLPLFLFLFFFCAKEKIQIVEVGPKVCQGREKVKVKVSNQSVLYRESSRVIEHFDFLL